MKQPRALPLLFLVQMWECFSFYGMRALLVLYMIDALSFSEYQSFGIYAVYTALVEMLVLLGGFLADKVWGLRTSIFLGGILITCGHVCLALSNFFFLSLAFIIVGSSLFKTNLKALLGLFYEKDDPRREAGFTLFYSGMNLGGFLAALSCGYIGHFYGWHAGFGIAAIGMLAGLTLLIYKRDILENKGQSLILRPLWMRMAALAGVLGLIPLCSFLLQNNALAIPLLPFIGVGALIYLFFQLKSLSLEQKKAIYILLGMISLLMIYFAFEELMGSLLMVFSDTYVLKTIFAFHVPTSVLLVMNPLTVILMGPLMAKMSSHPSKKLPFAFLSLTAAFAILYLGTLQGEVPSFFLLGSFFFIALGELFIAPTIYAHCSGFAPAQLKGIMMSLVTMGFAYGSLVSGTLSQKIAPRTLAEYGDFFLSAAAIALGIVLIFFFRKSPLSKPSQAQKN